MAILSKGTTFASGDQVTAANLNNLVDASTFDTPADNSTIQKNGSGLLAVKDAGITLAKLATDAYTTGTWTPSIGGSATYSGRSATYTKIGRLVFVTGNITISSIGTGSQYQISGLPFTAASDASLAVSNWSNSAAAYNYLVVNVNSGTTTASVHGVSSASTSIDITPTFFANSAGIKFSGVYYV